MPALPGTDLGASRPVRSRVTVGVALATALTGAVPALAADGPPPRVPIDARDWPAPGDPWPADLDGPVVLVDATAGAVPGDADGASSGAAPALGAALPANAGAVEAGECFAEVRVPASWRIEPVEVVVREPTERFEITPARLVEVEREVVVREAHERLVPVQPSVRVEPRELEHRPAGSRLVRGTPRGDVPASPAELDAIAAAGIDPEALPVGACVDEWYEAPERSVTTRRVVVREASQRLAVEPATFEDVELSIETRPAHARLVEIPAAWRELEREVLVEPATTTWVPGEGAIERIDEATGRLMCRVDVPARHVDAEVETIETPAMVTRIEEKATHELVPAVRVLRAARERRDPVPAEFDVLSLYESSTDDAAGDWLWLPGGVRPLESAHEPTGRAVCRREVPAVTARWERAVITAPGRFEREAVPAETLTVNVIELAAEASVETVPVPALTRRVTRRTHLADAHVDWRPVLCRTNVTEDVVRRLQRALDEAGHSPGGIDGMMGPGTRGAVEGFQRERGLATGGLTLETLSALDVTPGPIRAADVER